MTVAHAAEPVEVETALHRARPEVKLVALLGFVLAVALVPHARTWPYAVDAVVLLAVAVWARVSPGFVARRLLVEIPFIGFVVLLPFFTEGSTTRVLGLSLSIDGLWAAWGIVAKATLAVLAAAVLAATTTAPELIVGLQRLRVPAPLVAIGSFAVRYVQVVMEALARVQVARVARGDDPRWLWQARAVGQSFGGLAVRCLQRGERVHASMLARGYDGTMPDTDLTLLRRRSVGTLSPVAGTTCRTSRSSARPRAARRAAAAARATSAPRPTRRGKRPRRERPRLAWALAVLVVVCATAANLGSRLA